MYFLCSFLTNKAAKKALYKVNAATRCHTYRHREIFISIPGIVTTWLYFDGNADELFECTAQLLCVSTRACCPLKLYSPFKITSCMYIVSFSLIYKIYFLESTERVSVICSGRGAGWRLLTAWIQLINDRETYELYCYCKYYRAANLLAALFFDPDHSMVHLFI